MKVVLIVGNRPQVIRSAPLALALRAAGMTEALLVIGLPDVEPANTLLRELEVVAPSHELRLDDGRTDWMVLSIAETLFGEDPDIVLVSGDSQSTLAGARAAVEAGILLAHVEAGVRSGDRETADELTRVEVDNTADWLFCPDEHAASRLRAEGVRGEIEVVGDAMLDAVRRFADVVHRRYPPLHAGPYVLATVQRQANREDPRLSRILEALNRLRCRVIVVAGPRGRSAVRAADVNIMRHVVLIDPLPYFEFTSLMSNAHAVVTDSGVLQREAYWHGVPCVTLRKSTEWPDTVSVGANVLVDCDPDAIEAAVHDPRVPERRPNVLGDGKASMRIARTLATSLRSQGVPA